MKLIFIGKNPEVGDIVTFRFRPIKPLDWLAGQSVRVELPAGYGTAERRFTIAAPPSGKVVAITTRISDSDFKLALNDLRPGEEVDAYTVEGTFTWRESPTPHLFVAGGVGITPFYAMLAERKAQGQPLAATLLYASKADFVFTEFWQMLQTHHPEFNLVLLPGAHITAELVGRYMQPESYIYLSGPSAMVDQVYTDVQEVAGVQNAQILRDWFTGRPSWT